MPRCACIAGESVTIAIPTLCTWTWDAFVSGSWLSPGIGITLRQNLLQCCVVPVDVIVEVNHSIFRDDHGAVDDQDRNRVREIHLLGRAAVHGRANMIQVPAGIVAQDPHSQVGGVFQPDTAVAEIPPRLCEEFGRWGVVHVHVVAIWEDKLHLAECVLCARLLPDEKLSGPDLTEFFARYRPFTNHPLLAVHNLESLFPHIAGVASNVWNQFPSGDGAGHLPVWPEDNILHGVAKHGSLVA